MLFCNGLLVMTNNFKFAIHFSVLFAAVVVAVLVFIDSE
jgi:hypothetical protein